MHTLVVIVVDTQEKGSRVRSEGSTSLYAIYFLKVQSF